MKIRNSFHTYAMITILIWSLTFVVSRLALQYFSPLSLAFLRFFIASCTLLVVIVVTKMQLPKKEDLPLFFVAGAIGFFFYMIAFNMGQNELTASTGSVVIATVPVMTAVLARFIYKEKLNKLKWFAIAIEFFGVAVLTLMNGVLSINKGLYWMFPAAIALSMYNIFQRKLIKKYSALQATTFSIFFGTILLGIFAPTAIRETISAPPIQWFYIMLLGVFSSAIAYVSWTKAFSKAKQTSQVSNYMFVTPFLTSVFGFLIVGEVPEKATIIGGGIILAGVFLFNFGDRFFKKRKQ